MIFSRNSLGALLGATSLFALTVGGCAADTASDVGEGAGAQTAAGPNGEFTVGVPRAPVNGTTDFSTFNFTDAGGIAFTRTAKSGLDLSAYGLGKLQAVPNHSATWSTTGKCSDAEKFVTNAAPTNTSNQTCYVEFSSDGVQKNSFWGVGVAITGLDMNGKGITSFSDPAGALSRNAKSTTVNQELDVAKVVAAMRQLETKFKGGPPNERNTCVKNPRATKWLDIQSHYYCLLPKSTIRECYSGNLIDGIENKKLDFFASANAAYTACFDSSNASRTPDGAWLDANQKDVFQYVMFKAQGAKDFNIESEQDAINAFYGSSARTRRLMDTYPNWLADQPRYAGIRQLQRSKGGQ